MANRWDVTVALLRNMAFACAFLVSTLTFGAKSVLTGGPYDGLVRDKATGAPVADALVLVKWMGTTPSMHSSRPLCYYEALATTGADGRFHVPAWSESTATGGDPTWLPYITPLQIEEFVFRAGYLDTPLLGRARNPQKIELEPFNGSLERWSRFLFLLHERGVCDGDFAKKRLPWERALAEDIDRLSVTRGGEFGKLEWSVWDGLLFGVDSLVYDDEEAGRRSTMRQRQHRERFQ